MPGSENPAAGSASLPPISATQFTNAAGFLTAAGLNLLQQLWANVFGTGGVIDKIAVAANPTSIAGASAINGIATTFMRSDGAPEVQTATDAVRGIVQPDGLTVNVNGAGVISIPTATILKLGLVKPDGVTINISAGGVISTGGSGGYTVATLPTAGTVGRTAWVTDAKAPTFLGVLTGGGAVVCPVFDNGAAWVAA